MATNFPGATDNGTSLPYPSALSKRNGPSLAGLNDNQNDAIIATQTKLGTGVSTPTASNLLVGTGVGTSSWSKLAPTGIIVGSTDTITLTNKTLTSPTITSPIITNASLTTDLISGFTTSNSGTVYGVPVTVGVLQTANTINGTAIVNASITGSKIASYSIARSNNGTAVAETSSRILTGWGVIAYNTGASAVISAVTFSTTFVTLPIVTITFGGDNGTLQTYGSGGNLLEGNVIAKAFGITTTGFTADLHKPSGANFSAGYGFFQWIAIGV